MAERIIPVLEARYREEVVPTLMEEFNYTNVMQAPRVSKVVVNIGMGEANDESKKHGFCGRYPAYYYRATAHYYPR